MQHAVNSRSRIYNMILNPAERHSCTNLSYSQAGQAASSGQTEQYKLFCFFPGRNCQRVQHTVTRIKSGPTLHRYPEEVRQALRLISAWWLPICSQEQQWVPDAKVRPCTYWQLVRSPCCQISTLMPYVVSAMEPRCGRQTCNGQTKTVDEVVDRMQYYKHSGRSRHLRANYNAARSVTRNRQEKVVRRAESEMQTWRRWMQQLEKTFKAVLDLARSP